jgi:hypothetical protein
MELEIKQVLGEGDEEEEEEEKKEMSPVEELESVLENYRHSEIAELHFRMHELIQEQKKSIRMLEFDLPKFYRIDEYLARIAKLAKRKAAVEKKCQNIKNRFKKVMGTLKKQKQIE